MPRGRRDLRERWSRQALRADQTTVEDLETWETATAPVEPSREQRARLVPSMAKADRRYRELLERFRRFGSEADAGRP